MKVQSAIERAMMLSINTLRLSSEYSLRLGKLAAWPILAATELPNQSRPHIAERLREQRVLREVQIGANTLQRGRAEADKVLVEMGKAAIVRTLVKAETDTETPEKIIEKAVEVTRGVGVDLHTTGLIRGYEARAAGQVMQKFMPGDF